MKKFLYVVVSDWDDRTDVLRVFKTLKDARNAFAKDKTFEIFRYAKVSFGEDIPGYMSCDYLFPEDKRLFLPRRKERKEDN